MSNLEIKNKSTGQSYSNNGAVFKGGEDLEISAKVKNYGPGDVSENVLVKYYVIQGNPALTYDTVTTYPSAGRDEIERGNLENGESETKSLSSYIVSTTPGIYTVASMLDPNENIIGDDRENNWRSFTFEVAQPVVLPDLQVPTLTLDGKTEEQTFQINQQVDLDFSVSNNGNPPANDAKFSLKIFQENNILVEETTGTITQADIADGSYVNTDLRITFNNYQTGRFYLQICADSENQIEESNENNNCKEIWFSISDIVQLTDIWISDLAVNSISSEEQIFSPNQTVELMATLAKTGPDFSGTIVNQYVVYDSGNNLIQMVQEDAIDACDLMIYNRVDFSVPSSAGRYYIRACIDVNNLIQEPDKTNNCRKIWFNVQTENQTIPGDIDSGGTVDIADAILVIQIMSGTEVYSVNLYADINGDGKIGLEEVVYILQKIAEIR